MLRALTSLRQPARLPVVKYLSQINVAGFVPFRPSSQFRGLASSPSQKFSTNQQAATSQRSKMSVTAGSKDELFNTPGVYKVPDGATKEFIFQQTMMRIKDPKRSLDFYTRVLGMTLLCKLDFADAKFSLYFLGYYPAEAVPDDPQERIEWMFKKPATVELTHNHGAESDDAVTFHSGNSDPRGFGHIGFEVPDVYAACKRFEDLGVEFQKKPDAGNMKGIAFIKDPDGYWIEILNAKASRAFRK